MLDHKDLEAVKKIIEEALGKHLLTCPLSDGFTKEELMKHSSEHRIFRDFMNMSGMTRRIWLYILGIVITIYIPLLIKVLWP